MDKIYKEVHDYRLKLAIEGPPILEDSPFLVKAVEDYRKEEFRKEHSYGNYQDRNLPKNKEIKVQPYIRKDSTTTVDINEYLRNLRKGVDR